MATIDAYYGTSSGGGGKPREQKDEERIVLAVSGWRRLKGPLAEQLVNERLTEFCARVGKPHAVVTGGAAGADQLAEAWARRRGIHVITIRPRPTKTKRDGQIECLSRNTLIVAQCTHLIAFPNGDAKGKKGGTQDAIHKALASNKRVRVVNV